MDLTPRPCPNAEELTVASGDGTTVSRYLRCPERGILAWTFATTSVMPPRPEWVGPPGSCGCPIEGSRDEAGFTKDPNSAPPTVKKVAQDLMHAAENTELSTTMAVSLDAGAAAPQRSGLVVELPALPDDVTVEVASIVVARGGWRVSIGRADAPDRGWYAHSIHHVERWYAHSERAGGGLPFYSEFIQMRHDTAGDAVAAAAAYQDALEAWDAAQEQSHAAVRGALEAVRGALEVV